MVSKQSQHSLLLIKHKYTFIYIRTNKHPLIVNKSIRPIFWLGFFA